MQDFTNETSQNGFHTKLWRGESMCMIGMDVDNPEPDFVGFAIEVKEPGGSTFFPLKNRLAFSYPDGVGVDGSRKFLSTAAPFQKFRWVHFPHDPKPGIYTYRVTKMHMPTDAPPVPGLSNTLDISLDPVTFDGKIDVGFTRNFASSQAYVERFGNRDDIIPASVDEGLQFVKPANTDDLYAWLGFEGRKLVFGMLDEAVNDPTIDLDVFVYDLNESAVVERLEALGPRLRAIIDNSDPHVTAASSEQRAADRLIASAGAGNVRRERFGNLQHNKVLIAKRNGVPFKVITGSTNFSYRGFYIQANNAIVFSVPEIAQLFLDAFELAFNDPEQLSGSTFAAQWHPVNVAGLPPISVCLSPHGKALKDIALKPVGDAIDHADSSVFYSIAFYNLITSGAVYDATQRLFGRDIFSYGAVNQIGKSRIKKPDGTEGIVDFNYLGKNSPEPFKSEWFGGKGINIHNKFVVVDFNLPTAKVFTGSSNLSPSGEQNNGDHLIMIEDQRIATAFAIEAVRLFDHLHFRSVMKDKKVAKATGTAANKLTLRKPTAISGKAAWFEAYYGPASQKSRDRTLFAH